MKDFFKKADAVFTIAKQVPACVVAFKAQDYQNNPTKIIDLSVSISKKLEADYGLKGNALEYLKSFVTDSIKTFDLISADIKDHEYIKTLSVFANSTKTLLADKASLVSAIMEDVNDAQSSSNAAIKEFKTDKVEAGINLFENIISAVYTEVESPSTDTPKDEL